MTSRCLDGICDQKGYVDVVLAGSPDSPSRRPVLKWTLSSRPCPGRKLSRVSIWPRLGIAHLRRPVSYQCLLGAFAATARTRQVRAVDATHLTHLALSPSSRSPLRPFELDWCWTLTRGANGDLGTGAGSEEPPMISTPNSPLYFAMALLPMYCLLHRSHHLQQMNRHREHGPPCNVFEAKVADAITRFLLVAK